LLPVFLDEPFEPSPYAPVSRLLWNEFYVDITRVPELAACESTQALIQSASFQAEIKAQQERPMVDYRKMMYMKRQAMVELCKCLVNSPTGRLEEFRRFAREHPMIEEYARFRAVMETQNAQWPKWPQRLRNGNMKEGDYDEEIKDYHLYAQWLAHQQVQALSENARNMGVKLYFDLPAGVHPAGYDVWRHQDVFALNAAAGAPPDAVFTNGQNWEFPPLHPENIREQHYRYVIDYLRHHLRYADMLRIDHVMGLHRLFWIPQGLDAGDGVYVRYHAEELYAILAVESHRHQSIIVGEDLGIVPSYVRPAMAKHGLSRMYILYYELAENNPNTFGHITSNTVASLNTHDMPPFAAFWQDIDIPGKKGLGLLDAKGARKERKTRQRIKAALIKGLRKKNLLRKADTGTRAILQACLAFLSNSPSYFVLINLEDLWLETQSQNVPGTGDKYPSWQRKARYSLEEFCRRQDVRDILERINSLRKQGENPVHKNKRL
jgi:4-alpha-glucanotransferase